MAGQEKYTYAPGPNDKLVHNLDAFTSILNDSPHRRGDEKIIGIPGKTGVVIHRNGHVAGGLRHPQRIPVAAGPDGVVFGGTPTIHHFEGSMQQTLGMDQVGKEAARMIEDIRGRGLKFVAQSRHAFGVGTESEMWAYNGDGTPFELPEDKQEELHHSLWETSTNPNLRPDDQALALAKDMFERVNKVPDALHNNTSMPISSAPHELEVNTDKGAKGEYVWAMQKDLFDRYFEPRDEIATQLWNKIGEQFGHYDFQSLKTAIDSLKVWACAAGHASFGLVHRPEHASRSFYNATEEAIAVADLFNSDFATVAEWMTYSTPIVFGTRVAYTDVNGEERHPRDVRAVLRYAMNTTYPAPFVETPERLKERITTAIEEGVSDRLDRASYISKFDMGNSTVQQVSAAHGRVRNRMAHGPITDFASQKTGRIEFTGSGATPDILAIVSRNAFLQLMGIYAYESLAHGQYPREYGAGNFPSMNEWQNQKDLSHAFNFYGMEGEGVQDIVTQAESFLDYMSANYKDVLMTELIKVAKFGLRRLAEPTVVRTLEEFLEKPNGSVSEVITHMYEDGSTPADIALAIHEYQVGQANQILEAGGIMNLLAYYEKSAVAA